MTQDFVVLLGALAALFIPMGVGARWLLTHIDQKAQAAAQAEKEARNALSIRLEKEIEGLRADMRLMANEKALFARRIYQLEHFIHTLPGVNIPTMEGWPPV